jgi:hypothetical protein
MKHRIIHNCKKEAETGRTLQTELLYRKLKSETDKDKLKIRLEKQKKLKVL